MAKASKLKAKRSPHRSNRSDTLTAKISKRKAKRPPRLINNSVVKISKPKAQRSPYHYSRLNEELNEIRLVTLHPGNFEADLEVSIQKVRLTPEDSPIYEALSFVWGSIKSMPDIKIGDDDLAVTKNLASALRHLRYEGQPRTLWVDAICINQQDLRERGQQVKRMADIYSSADRVVAWLGPGKDESGLGMKIIEQMSSQIEVDWGVREMKPASTESEPHWSNEGEALPFGIKELHAINGILSSPWFERLWVQQEIQLANLSAILMIGFDVIAWQTFRKAISCIFWKDQPCRLPRLDDRVKEVIKCVDYDSERSFLDIMQSTSWCKCGDPKDRVYAILSLIKESDIIEPDYRNSTRQVYQDITLRYIARTKSIDILRCSGLEGIRLGMPSWVPSWNLTGKNPNFFGVQASAQSSPEVQFRGPGTLNVLGVFSATVQQTESLRCKTHEKLIAKIQKIAPNDSLEASYVGGGSLLAAYGHSIGASYFAEMTIPHYKVFPRIQPSLDFLTDILQPGRHRVPEPEDGTEAKKFLISSSVHLHKCCFIKTREGYIGLAPPVATAGDQVCILFGCSTPMLLRPTPNHLFRVVGQCYVHGLMTGEAFLGPLPDHYQLLSVLDRTQSSYVLRFYDHRTGETQTNDPRLGSTPDSDKCSVLTPEMIAERGVKLRTFALV